MIMDTVNYMRSRRTIRQFRPERLPDELLRDLVDTARLAPSASNKQPLEFVVVSDPVVCQKIYPHLRWAAYIKPAGDPKPGQEPTSYVIVLVNSRIRDSAYEWDSGAAIENMIITAWSKGVGSCWLLSIEREKIREVLGIPDFYMIDSALALGYPAEEPQVEDLSDSVEYWKDEQGRLHVPKRRLQDVLHFNRFGARSPQE
jgi:nitroreductase